MREKPDMPLTPVELFRRGIEITREIRGRIEEARAYYLGRSSREPEKPLSEVFERMTGKGRSADLQPDAWAAEPADQPSQNRREVASGIETYCNTLQ